MGGTGENPTDDPGWFIVIQERLGEPRFGLDLPSSDTQMLSNKIYHTWNDLSWTDAIPGGQPGDYIAINQALMSLKVTPPTKPEDQEKEIQYLDDKNIHLDQVNAASLAYILFQAPVMVAVHEEMSKPNGGL
jgi:hypothetical protein